MIWLYLTVWLLVIIRMRPWQIDGRFVKSYWKSIGFGTTWSAAAEDNYALAANDG